MKELRDRVAVVTGAASGIGQAMCRRFAGEGMRVVMADVEATALEAARKELAGAGREVIAVPTDVSQADQVSALAEKALEAFGRVHVVCNNAGVFAGGTSWEAPLSDYEWTFGVNLWGVIHGVRTFVPILLEHGEPSHVVNTASMAAVTRAPFVAAYYMSKHAVLTLSETLYLEMQAQDAPVGVSVLCPELIDTGIGRSDRNRPPHLKRGQGEEGGVGAMADQVLREATPRGLDPSVMADRVVEAIREEQLYILSEEGGTWRQACDARLEDLRLARNPTGGLLAGTN